MEGRGRGRRRENVFDERRCLLVCLFVCWLCFVGTSATADFRNFAIIYSIFTRAQNRKHIINVLLLFGFLLPFPNLVITTNQTSLAHTYRVRVCVCVCVEKESRERGDTWSIRGAKARVSDCVCAQGEEPAEPAAPAAQANHVPVSTAAISPCHATAGTHTVRCVSMLLLC